MSRYIQYPTADGGTVLVEIENQTEIYRGGAVQTGLGDVAQEAVVKVTTTFEDAVDVVRRTAQAIIDQVKGLSDSPDEVKVTFGLKATGDLGNLAVAKVGAEANYTVELTWKKAEPAASAQPRRRSAS